MDFIQKIKEDFGDYGLVAVWKSRKNHICFYPKENGKVSKRAIDTKTDDASKAYLIIGKWVRDGFPVSRKQKKQGSTFADFCRRYWVDNPENRNVTKMHAKTCVSWVESHVRPHFKDLALMDVTPPQVQEFLSGLKLVETHRYKLFKEKGCGEFLGNKYLAPSTIKGIKNVISLPLQYAARIGLNSKAADWLVVCRIKSARNGKDGYFKNMVRPCDIFEPEELRKLDTADWDNYEAQMCYKLIRHTGMRFGEARGIKVGKILPDRVIIDTGYNNEDKEKWTKNEQYREVPIPQWLYLEIGAYIASFPLEDMKKKDSWLFPSITDFSKPVGESFLGEKLDNMLKKLKIPKVRKVRGVLCTRSVHSLRHCKDMELMAAGLTIKQISDTVGHSEVMVMHYTDHYSDSEFDVVARKMSAAGLMDNPNKAKEENIVLKMADRLG